MVIWTVQFHQGHAIAAMEDWLISIKCICSVSHNLKQCKGLVYTSPTAVKSVGFRSKNCESVQETSIDGTDSFQRVSE